MQDDETQDETEATDEAEAVGTDEPAREPVVGGDGARVEPVGATGRIHVWECSIGDFVSRVSAAEVEAHIKLAHGKPSGGSKSSSSRSRR